MDDLEPLEPKDRPSNDGLGESIFLWLLVLTYFGYKALFALGLLDGLSLMGS